MRHPRSTIFIAMFFAAALVVSKTAYAWTLIQNCTFGPVITVSNTYRYKVCNFPSDSIQDEGGIIATDFRNMRITIAETRSPDGKLHISQQGSWEYYNRTSGGHPLLIGFDAYDDVQGPNWPTDGIVGWSDRGTCNYNGVWSSASIAPQTTYHTHIDTVKTGRFIAVYNSLHEGTC